VGDPWPLVALEAIGSFIGSGAPTQAQKTCFELRICAVRDTGIEPVWPPHLLTKQQANMATLRGPSWDHTLSAIVNDLHVCERYAWSPHTRRLCVTRQNVLPLFTGGQVV